MGDATGKKRLQEALAKGLQIKKPALPPGVSAGGHGGSHGYLSDDFIDAILRGRKPAVDVMFNSLVKTIQGGILAVVLTGMGADGLAGVRALKAHKDCYCITQDQASCAVYGMPAEIVKAGLSDQSLPPARIAERLTQIARARKTVTSA